MLRFVTTASLALATLVALAAWQPVRAQYVQVYSAPPPVMVNPAPVATYSYYPPTTAYYPAASVPYYSYSVPTYSYAVPSYSYSAPVYSYAPPLYAAPGGVTTRSYYGFGILRPRGLYTQSYYNPPGVSYYR